MNIIDIIEDLVLTANFTVKAEQITETDPNTWRIDLCSTSYINKCTPIYQEGNEYTVVEIGDGYVIVTGSIEPIYGTMEIKPPEFVHGTYTDAGKAKLEMSKNSINNNVLVHFSSTPLNIKKMYSGTRVFKSTVKVQLLFLSGNRREEIQPDGSNRYWCPDDHYNQCINQMNKLADLVIANISKKRELKRVSEVDQVNVINIGITQDKKGVEKNLFDFPHSGVAINFELELIGQSACCC